MPSVRLRRVVATRRFEVAALHGGVAQQVVVAFAKPVRVPGSRDYACFYQVVGGSRAGIRHAIGVDSVQALLLAFTNAASILYTSFEYKEGRLTHLTDPNLGLPAIAATLGDLVPGEKTVVFF
jgi:hypothetical protein